VSSDRFRLFPDVDVLMRLLRIQNGPVVPVLVSSPTGYAERCRLGCERSSRHAFDFVSLSTESRHAAQLYFDSRCIPTVTSPLFRRHSLCGLEWLRRKPPSSRARKPPWPCESHFRSVLAIWPENHATRAGVPEGVLNQTLTVQT
jgi:hypothetical protein